MLRQGSVVGAWVMMLLVWTDRLDEAEQISSALICEGERLGSAYLVAHLSFPRAFVANRPGQVREAEADARWGFEQKLARGVSEGRTWQLVPLVNSLIDQGDREGAERALGSTCLPAVLPEQLGWALVLEARGRLRLAQGRAEGALADLLEAGRRWEHLCWGHLGIMEWRSEAARAFWRLGDRAEAARLAHEQLELAQATELDRPIGAAVLAAGLVAPQGRRLSLLQEAVGRLERTPPKLELARALVELGATLRRGLELAHRAAARLLTQSARGERALTRGSPRQIGTQ